MFFPVRKIAITLVIMVTSALAAAGGNFYPAKTGAGGGQGKHIVLLSGDEEYRSEEGLPQMAKILSQQHGFNCTVLFPIDPTNGSIAPNNQTNIPGMEVLVKADLVICQFRFRELPDPDTKYFVDYLNSGRPLMVVRTATHAFSYTRNKTSPYAWLHWQAPDGGFGGRVVGETWTYHHGDHGKEATRGLIEGKNRSHPILKEVNNIFGPSDVYGVHPNFPSDASVLVQGQVLIGMQPTDPPNLKKAIMPIVWLRNYRGSAGKDTQVLCSTIGAATDLLSADLRRLFVNASYHLLGFEVPAKASVDLIGDYTPTAFGFNTAKKGVQPSSLLLKP